MEKVINISEAKNYGRNLTPKWSQRKKFCSHDHASLDQEHRILECDDCGQILEAFDWLWSQAVNEQRAFESVMRLEKEVAQLTKQRNELQEQVNRLKNQSKYYQKKLF